MERTHPRGIDVCCTFWFFAMIDPIKEKQKYRKIEKIYLFAEFLCSLTNILVLIASLFIKFLSIHYSTLKEHRIREGREGGGRDGFVVKR